MTALTLAIYRAPLGSTYVSISALTDNSGIFFGLNARFRMAIMRGNAFNSVASFTICSYVPTTVSVIGNRW